MVCSSEIRHYAKGTLVLRRIRSVNYLDSYVTSAPGPQNALGIFQGEWSSILPPPLTDFQAGSASLFNDSRVTWFVEEVGGIEGRSVLELGPLEGGHSFMFERLGAGGHRDRGQYACLPEVLDHQGVARPPPSPLPLWGFPWVLAD